MSRRLRTGESLIVLKRVESKKTRPIMDSEALENESNVPVNPVKLPGGSETVGGSDSSLRFKLEWGNVPQWVSAIAAAAATVFAAYTIVHTLVPFTNKVIIETEVENLRESSKKLRNDIEIQKDEKELIKQQNDSLKMKNNGLSRSLSLSKLELLEANKRLSEIQESADKIRSEYQETSVSLKELSEQRWRLLGEITKIQTDWNKQALKSLVVGVVLRVPAITYQSHEPQGENTLGTSMLSVDLYDNSYYYTPIPLDCKYKNIVNMTTDVQKITAVHNGRQVIEALLKDPFWQLMPEIRADSLKKKIRKYMEERKAIFDERLCVDQRNLPFSVEYFESGMIPFISADDEEAARKARNKEMNRIASARRRLHDAMGVITRSILLP